MGVKSQVDLPSPGAWESPWEATPLRDGSGIGAQCTESARAAAPCSAKLMDCYEAAKARIGKVVPEPELVKRFGTKLGKLMYAVSSNVRPDLAYAVNMCARTTTYPTAEMEQRLDEALVYAGQTAGDGITFGINATPTCTAYSDSDWHVSHSTSAHCIMYGEACICYGSRRQKCIAMSSTEAEIIAASQAALEIVYVRALLREMGVPMDEPTVLYVDNSGAVELAKHRKSSPTFPLAGAAMAMTATPACGGRLCVRASWRFVRNI